MRTGPRLILLALACLVLGAPAWALDPSRTLAQYKHTRWTVDDGAPGSIYALAQGRNGYLWIGGRDGLFRFDGVSFEKIRSSADDGAGVSALLAARDGTIWVGYAQGGVATYRDGVLRDVGVPFPGIFVLRFAQTRDGAIWIQLGRAQSQLFRYADGRWERMVARLGAPPSEGPMDMMAARDGALWVTTTGAVSYLAPGAERFVRIDEGLKAHAALSQDAAGRIWVSDGAGSRVISPSEKRRTRYATPESTRRVHTFFDRDGNLRG